MRISDRVSVVRDGDNRYKVSDAETGFVLGWIESWYLRDAVNGTGIKMWRASILCVGVIRHDCESYSSALSAILHASYA